MMRNFVSLILVVALCGLVYGFAGGDGTTGNPYQVSTVADIIAVNNDLDASYIMINDIDLAGQNYTQAPIGVRWYPGGVQQGDPFEGIFDGNGYVIQNLSITDTTSDRGVGLFGTVWTGAVIRNLGIEGAYVNGVSVAGALAGTSLGTVLNCYFLDNPAVVSVTGNVCVGGLIGVSSTGSNVVDCWAVAGVEGSEQVGGFVGQSQGTITNCYAMGNVHGTNVAESRVGGFIGLQYSGELSDCYATGNVTSNGYRIGGFCGQLGYSTATTNTIDNCYATGNVSYIGTGVGLAYVGGLVGLAVGEISESYATGDVDSGTGARAGGLVAQASLPVSNCYATGDVSGASMIGGVVGITGDTPAQVNNCYSTGTVTGSSYVGGVIGYRYRGAVNNCFWDIDTSGTTVGSGAGGGDVTGKTTAEMQTESTFTDAGWDFGEVWYMSQASGEFEGYPALYVENHTWDSLENGDLVWNDQIGLWSTVVDGTRKHSSWFSTSNLLLAGRYGLLDDPRIESVLQALYDMQYPNGAIKKYYEDTSATDANMSFFICRILLLFRHVYESELSAGVLTKLDQAVMGLYTLLYSQSMAYNVRYTNTYIGNTVCARLVQELYSMTGAEVDEVKAKMLDAAEYWRDNEWGWGEHLSDTYAGVSVDLISIYLLFTNEPQGQIYSEYKDLMAELLYIEDIYGEGPRVPAIRSYAFTGRSPRINYRDTIVPWHDGLANTLNHFYRESYLMHGIFYDYGWSNIEPLPRSSTATHVSIPCYDGAVGTGFIEDDIRLGSMSNYPIMPDTEHLTWGLSWQVYPVAFWKPQGDWAFLQWQTVENGQVKAHPANYNGGPVALTSMMEPPYHGRTYSYQEDGNVLVVRVMPEITSSWDSVADLFKIVDRTASVKVSPLGSGFKQLLLTYPERTVSVGMVPVTGQYTPRLWYDQNAMYWGVTCSGTEIAAQDTYAVVNIWGISLDGEIIRAPEIEIVEPIDPSRTDAMQKRNIKWPWPNGRVWHVQIDPMSEDVITVNDNFILNPVDLNIDHSIDFLDMVLFVEQWLQ